MGYSQRGRKKRIYIPFIYKKETDVIFFTKEHFIKKKKKRRGEAELT